MQSNEEKKAKCSQKKKGQDVHSGWITLMWEDKAERSDINLFRYTERSSIGGDDRIAGIVWFVKLEDKINGRGLEYG